MYPGILLSKSSLYKTTYPLHQNQKSDMDPPLPPGFAPIHPGFGENHYEKFHGQPHSAINPTYQEHQMYSVQETSSQGFGFQHGQVMDSSPFYNQSQRFRYQYSVQQQVMTYPVTQPANQTQHQQVQVERNAQEVLIVELERPAFPMTRPRLRWTPELHERFNRAAQELGGYFSNKTLSRTLMLINCSFEFFLSIYVTLHLQTFSLCSILKIACVSNENLNSSFHQVVLFLQLNTC